MCGITGAIWTDNDKALQLDDLKRMTEVLRHRGPDDEGLLRSECQHRPPYDSIPGVALGFRRLSIIDLEGGRQPMTNEDQSIWLVFNGEIYNYKTLRKRLEGRGHQFRTESDSETIVHLYEDEGPRCFAHLNGMFSIAIWDAPHRRLVLGRDRLGQKPLLYRREAGRLLFASEMKSLLEAPDVPREIDPRSVDEYITYQYVPHPNTIFRGIHKLPPGHFAVYQDDSLEVTRYWDPDFNEESELREADAAAQFRELFESSVALRMQSDVPLGSFLSGGVDSSLVAAVMQKHSEEPIRTFSIGFSEPEFDETEYARTVAKHIGSQHEEFQVSPEAVDVLPKLIWSYDEPLADCSTIPTWYLSKMTRDHVTVALSGDGGDELFAGYPRYRAVRLADWFDRWPLMQSVGAAKFWQRLPASSRQTSKVRQFKRFNEALRMSPARRYLDWISTFNEPRRAALYNDEFLAQLDSDPLLFLQQAFHRSDKRDALTTASLADLITYLPCVLNTKVDIASMAHSLEVRQPFLDYRCVEFAASLPIRFKYRRRRGKHLLQTSFGDLLPNEIFRRAKMGFGVPLNHWFRSELQPLVRDTLLGDDAKTREFLQPEAVKLIVDEHVSERVDHSYRLWSLLVLEMWMREWCASPIQVV